MEWTYEGSSEDSVVPWQWSFDAEWKSRYKNQGEPYSNRSVMARLILTSIALSYGMFITKENVYELSWVTRRLYTTLLSTTMDRNS